MNGRTIFKENRASRKFFALSLVGALLFATLFSPLSYAKQIPTKSESFQLRKRLLSTQSKRAQEKVLQKSAGNATALFAHILTENYDIGALQEIQLIKEGRYGETYIVYSDRGKYILQLRDVARDFVDFEAAVLDSGSKTGLVTTLIRARNNEDSLPLRGRTLTLNKYLEGQPGNWNDVEGNQLNSAAKALAKFQEGTTDVVPMFRSNPWLHELPIVLLNRLKEAQKKFETIELLLRKKASTVQLNEAEQYFIDHYPFYIDQLEKLRNNLQRNMDQLKPSIVHGDYHPRNVLFLGNGVNGIIDFGYSHVGFRIEDLANVMFETGTGPDWGQFDWGKARTFIETYRHSIKEPLTPEEIRLIPEMFRRLYLQEVLLNGHQLAFTQSPNLRHKLNNLAHSTKFLEELDQYPWGEIFSDISSKERDFVEFLKRTLYEPYFQTSKDFPYDETSLSTPQKENQGTSVRDRCVDKEGVPTRNYSLGLIVHPEPNSFLLKNLVKVQKDFSHLPFAKKFYMTPADGIHFSALLYAGSQKERLPQDFIEEKRGDFEKNLLPNLSAFDLWLEGLTVDKTSGRILAQIFPLPKNDGSDSPLYFMRNANSQAAPRITLTLITPFLSLTESESLELWDWVERNRNRIFGRMHVTKLKLLHTYHSYGGAELIKEYTLNDDDDDDDDDHPGKSVGDTMIWFFALIRNYLSSHLAFVIHKIENWFGLNFFHKPSQYQKDEETIVKVSHFTEEPLVYRWSYQLTAIALSVYRALGKKQLIVVQLDRFVKVKGETLKIPRILNLVLKGVVDAIHEAGEGNVKIAIVFDSPKREQAIHTLIDILGISYDSGLVQFSFPTAEVAKLEIGRLIEKENLSVPFVMTLFPEQWEGYSKITLGKLLWGLMSGYEMKIEGKFREALESVTQELKFISGGQIIKKDGQLILKEKSLNLEPNEDLWKESLYEMQA